MIDNTRKNLTIACIALACLAFSSCAILKAVSKVETVFLNEEDLALAGEALPTFIKVSEILLEAEPTNQGKVVSTASLYMTYGNAFVEGPAAMLPPARFEEKTAALLRAGALYRRAFRLLGPALERRAPGILAAADKGLAQESSPVGAPGSPVGKSGTIAQLAKLKKDDVPLLYWSAASILASFANNPLDFDNARHVAAAGMFLRRGIELDPEWNGGALYELCMQYYAGLPDYLGGDISKARDFYERALQIGGGKASPSLYVTYAGSICAPTGDYAGYKAALDKALAIDTASLKNGRLPAELARRRARYLLDNADEYFDIDGEE